MLVGQVGGFVRVFAEIVEADRSFVIPGMDQCILGNVSSRVAHQQLPVLLDTPQILEGVIRRAGTHVVDGVGDAKHGVALGSCGFIH